MSTITNNKDTELIACEVCLQEIPKSGAKSAEASDYMLYFCGLDCYEKWQESHKHSDKKNHSNEKNETDKP